MSAKVLSARRCRFQRRQPADQRYCQPQSGLRPQRRQRIDRRLSLDPRGHLSSVAGSVRSLGGSGTGPAEIAFSPDGNFLVVTEKNTNKIAVSGRSRWLGRARHWCRFVRHDAVRLCVRQARPVVRPASAAPLTPVRRHPIASAAMESSPQSPRRQPTTRVPPAERDLAGRTFRLHLQHWQRHDFRLPRRLRRTDRAD